MYLYDGYVDTGYGVPEGYRRVGISAWVKHDACHILIRGVVQAVYESAFVITLETFEGHVWKSGSKPVLEIGKRCCAIGFRLSFSQEVEIGAIHNEQFHEALKSAWEESMSFENEPVVAEAHAVGEFRIFLLIEYGVCHVSKNRFLGRNLLRYFYCLRNGEV